MSAFTTKLWRQKHTDQVHEHNRNYMRRKRMSAINANLHITRAFAQRFHCSVKAVEAAGTLRLCLCKDDSTRRLLLGIGEK